MCCILCYFTLQTPHFTFFYFSLTDCLMRMNLHNNFFAFASFFWLGFTSSLLTRHRGEKAKETKIMQIHLMRSLHVFVCVSLCYFIIFLLTCNFTRNELLLFGSRFVLFLMMFWFWTLWSMCRNSVLWANAIRRRTYFMSDEGAALLISGLKIWVIGNVTQYLAKVE